MKKVLVVSLSAWLTLVLASCGSITLSSSSDSSQSLSPSPSSTSASDSEGTTSDKTTSVSKDSSSTTPVSSASSYVESKNPNEPAYSTNPVVDPARYSYANRIAKPSATLSSYQELSRYLDYAAFYHEASTAFTLNYSYSSLAGEINKAYWASPLMVCTVDFSITATSGNDATVTFQYYDEAKKHYNNATRQYTHSDPLLPPHSRGDDSPRSSTFSAFPYLNRSASVDVVSTQQLIYALREGYLPLPQSGTPAASALTTMQGLLRNIVTDSMNELEKVAAIYAYVGSHVCYEFAGDDYAGYYSKSNYPNALVAVDDGFYLEGALQGFGVCEGYCKLFVALCQMENLPVYNVSGFPTGFNVAASRYSVSRGSWDTHSYAYYLKDNSYYLIDPSWNQGEYGSNSNLSWNWFCSTKASHKANSLSFDDSTYLPTSDPFATKGLDVFAAFAFTLSGVSHTFALTNQTDFNAACLEFAKARASGLYSADGDYVIATFGVTSSILYDLYSRSSSYLSGANSYLATQGYSLSVEWADSGSYAGGNYATLSILK